MWPVSSRFLDALTSTHEAVCRCWLLQRTAGTEPLGTGTSPGGALVPVIAGDVKYTRTGDVKATLEVTIPGEWWQQVQPLGCELFVERGIDFGDGTQEYAPLGYFRVDDVQQDSAPDGPLRVSGSDRIAQVMQNRTLYPYQIPDGTTHRTIFERFINGRAPGGLPTVSGYGIGSFTYVPLTIVWTGYNPDTATVVGGQVAEDSMYEVLVGLAADRDCVLRMADTGELLVELRDGPTDAVPSFTVHGGAGGNLVRAARQVTRDGVYNIVSAYGSDPASPTGYATAIDRVSRVQYATAFGPAPRYFASPLLRTRPQAQAAADTLLSKYGGLPTSLSLDIVPSPHIRPNDLGQVELASGAGLRTYQVEEHTLPLTGSSASRIVARTYLETS